MWVILLKASTPLSPRCTTCSIHPQAAVAMSTLAVSSGVQRGFFTEEGRGAARLLSGNQCSTSEVGWLLGIPQWNYCGQENMESQRKRHYDIMQSVQMHVCVACVSVCAFVAECICPHLFACESLCVCVCVCEILNMCLCISTMLPCACEHRCCMCIHVFSHCWCIMHDKKTICKAALALIWPDCCFRLGHPD